MKKIRIAAFVLMVIWMGYIFAMSQRTADESTKDSEKVGAFIGKMVVPNFEKLDEEAQHEFVVRIDHDVRKTAHFLEYALLGILAFFVFYDGVGEHGIFCIKAFSVAFFYSVTDEFHQLFISGRSGQFSDVFIDSMGALAGLLAVTVGVALIAKLRKSNDRKNASAL